MQITADELGDALTRIADRADRAAGELSSLEQYGVNALRSLAGNRIALETVAAMLRHLPFGAK